MFCNQCKKELEISNYDKKKNGQCYKICNICRSKYSNSKLETAKLELHELETNKIENNIIETNLEVSKSDEFEKRKKQILENLLKNKDKDDDSISTISTFVETKKKKKKKKKDKQKQNIDEKYKYNSQQFSDNNFKYYLAIGAAIVGIYLFNNSDIKFGESVGDDLYDYS